MVFWVAVAAVIFRFGGILAEGLAFVIALAVDVIRRRSSSSSAKLSKE
jgi:hypothetical protein